MRRSWAIGLLVIALLLGFFQEWLKVGINYYLDQSAQISGFYSQDPDERERLLQARAVDAPFDYYYSHEKLDVLHPLSRRQIQGVKWGLAALLIGLNFLINLFMLRWWDGRGRSTDRLLVGMYVIVVIICAGFLIGGKLIGAPEPGYNIARKALGFLQSPFPALLLLLGMRLNLELNNKEG